MRSGFAWLLGMVGFCCACGHAAPERTSTATTERLYDAYGWLAIDSVPLYQQEPTDNGGPTALAMVLAYWHPGWPRREDTDRAKALPASDETLRDRALAYGFEATLLEPGTVDDIEAALGRGQPLIARLIKRTVVDVERFEVIVGMHRRSHSIATLDPSAGLRTRTLGSFLREWTPAGRRLLVVLPQPRAQLAQR
jgi:lambda repressor-like predicted transcriptional regulator